MVSGRLQRSAPCALRFGETGGSGRRSMSKLSILGEFTAFLRQNKKLWLLPIVLVLVLLGALLVFAQTSALAPFIYTVF